MSTEAGNFCPQKSIYLSFFFLPEVLGVLPHPWSIIDNFVHPPPLPFWISRLLEIPLAYKNRLSSDEPELISQRRGIQRCPIGYRALLWRVSILGCWRMNLERENEKIIIYNFIQLLTWKTCARVYRMKIWNHYYVYYYCNRYLHTANKDNNYVV